MIISRTARYACGFVASLLLASGVLPGGDKISSGGGDGTTSGIVWGQHWAGLELKDAKSLEGKVVLLKIWGGCVGCRGITPGMVDLARKHRDEPFHLVASYCQLGEKGPTLEFLKSTGWSDEMENLSVMYQTRYAPEVEVAHVPYYLLFDHTGKLRYHHMAGPYHGGNGDKYQEQVAELLKEVRKTPGGAKQPLSDLRSWANAQGKLIEASLLGVTDGRAKFRMQNGRTYEYPLEKLSPQTRKEIAELVGE